MLSLRPDTTKTTKARNTRFILPQASSDTDTFWGVFAARKYLEKEFSRRDLPAEMHVVGPTPFHADLSVKAADIEQDFELVLSPGKGSDKFTFLYSKESFSSPEIAAVTLIDRISDELSLFYSFNSTQEGRWRERNELVALVQNLIDIYQAKGFKARLCRMFTSSAKIRRVALKAVIAEYQSQGDERTSRDEMDELYSRGVTPYFRDFLESEVASRHESEILAARETISILDQARQKQIEVSSLFFSAIAGGWRVRWCRFWLTNAGLASMDVNVVPATWYRTASICGLVIPRL